MSSSSSTRHNVNHNLTRNDDCSFVTGIAEDNYDVQDATNPSLIDYNNHNNNNNNNNSSDHINMTLSDNGVTTDTIAAVSNSQSSTVIPSPPPPPPPDSTTSITLDTYFMYWNSVTNEVSKVPITVRQLCRILCPPTQTASSSSSSQPTLPTTATSVSSIMNKRPITLDTNVIQLVYNNNTNSTTKNNKNDEEYDDTDNDNTYYNDSSSTTTSIYSYSSDGWIVLRDVPIVHEAAVVQWYYYYDFGESSSNSNNNNNYHTNPYVHGPVTCRELSKLFYNNHRRIISNDPNQVSTNIVLNLSTNVCPLVLLEGNDTTSSIPSRWMPIRDIPNLILAMEAFYDVDVAMPNTTTTIVYNNTTATTTTHHQQNEESSHTNHQLEEENNYATKSTTTRTKTKAIISKKDTTTISQINPSSVQDELELFLSGMIDNDTNKRKHAANHNSDDDDDDISDDNTDGDVENNRNDNDMDLVLDSIEKETMHNPNTHITSRTNNNNNNNNSSSNNNDNHTNLLPKKKKKKKKSQFASKHSKNWIYVYGLPYDCTIQELMDTFSKAGIIDLDPDTQKPKIKLYTRKTTTTTTTTPYGSTNDTTTIIHNTDTTTTTESSQTTDCGNGDASICYARPESVELAITLFDGTTFIRSNNNNNINHNNEPFIMHVERAKFVAKKSTDAVKIEQQEHKVVIQKDEEGEQKHIIVTTKKKKKPISNAKRKVVRLAAIQAMTWDEGEFNGRITGGRKGLRIIVIKYVFHLLLLSQQQQQQQQQLEEEEEETSKKQRMISNSIDKNKDNDKEEYYHRVEQTVRTHCENTYGIVEKITVFTKNPNGIVIVKFVQPGSASHAVQDLNTHAEQYTYTIFNVPSPPSTTAGSNSTCIRNNRRRIIEASFWDGVTDYTHADENNLYDETTIGIEKQEEMKRHDEFGNWLEQSQQELPPELQLQIES